MPICSACFESTAINESLLTMYRKTRNSYLVPGNSSNGLNDELEAEVLVIGAYPSIADPSRHTVSLPRLARIVSLVCLGIEFPRL